MTAGMGIYDAMQVCLPNGPICCSMDVHSEGEENGKENHEMEIEMNEATQCSQCKPQI